MRPEDEVLMRPFGGGNIGEGEDDSKFYTIKEWVARRSDLVRKSGTMKMRLDLVVSL